MAVAIQTFHSQSKAGSRKQKLLPFKSVSFIWEKNLKSPSQISSYISLESIGSQAGGTWQRGMGLAVLGWVGHIVSPNKIMAF